MPTIAELRALAKTFKESGKLSDCTVQPLIEGIGTEGLREWMSVLVDDSVVLIHKVDYAINILIKNRRAIGLIVAAGGCYIGYQYMVNKSLAYQIQELRKELNKWKSGEVR